MRKVCTEDLSDLLRIRKFESIVKIIKSNLAINLKLLPAYYTVELMLR